MPVLISNRQRPAGLYSASRKVLSLLGLAEAELSILLVDDKKMRQLNFAYRGADKTTDVLSFPQISEKWEIGNEKLNKRKKMIKSSTSHFLLGDVVINLQAAKRQASEHGLSLTEEIRWLLVHGILHLMGYDHEKSKYAGRKMRTKEKELLGYFGRSSK